MGVLFIFKKLMASALKDFFLYFSSVLFALMGLGALINPNLVTFQFGIPTLSIPAKNEIRAVYGGFGIFMSAILILGANVPNLRLGIGYAISAALFGMAFGRVISTIIDRKIHKLPMMYFCIEIIIALIVLFGSL